MLRAIDPASVNARNPHILICMLRLLRAGLHRLNGCSPSIRHQYPGFPHPVENGLF
ncbi:hypothetical protein BN439_3155 [Erwinia amylovora Ea644]|nr:hypothetical protein BN439_3155 [Erwinia amylovora Ea644]CCP08257.1 hypothetical protein BN440_3252 [Erwinia amylovora MR1]